MRVPVRVVGLALLLAAAPRAALAQRSAMARADTLLRAGHLHAADSLYWRGWRRAPRDPAVRAALGRYLAGRGALKVGAVLMEEALFFGGDTAAVGRELARLYERLGDYGALADLPAPAVPPARRARARWLQRHPPTANGPDSSIVPYRAAAAGESTLGTMLIVVGGDSMRVGIDPRASGVVLDAATGARAGARTFGALNESGSARAGVIPTLRVGAITLHNVPATIVSGRSATTGPSGAANPRWRATLGLDVLARLAATVDASRGTILLRRGGHVPRGMPGTRAPFVILPGAAWIARGDALLLLGGEDAAAMLLGAAWTLDERRGVFVLDAR